MKTVSVWSCPDILVIHLKRFRSTGSYRDKLDVQVDFPLRGLDMSPWINGGGGAGNVYDLYGVTNHSGSLHGGSLMNKFHGLACMEPSGRAGHYTSFVRKWSNGHLTDEWLFCNDASVTPASPADVVSQRFDRLDVLL